MESRKKARIGKRREGKKGKGEKQRGRQGEKERDEKKEEEGGSYCWSKPVCLRIDSGVTSETYQSYSHLKIKGLKKDIAPVLEFLLL